MVAMEKVRKNSVGMSAPQIMTESVQIPYEDLSSKTTIQVGIWLTILVSWYCWAYYTSIPLAKEALPLISLWSIWSISNSLNSLSKK